MKQIILFMLISIFFSCKKENEKSLIESQILLDSLRKEQNSDSTIYVPKNQSIKERYLDTLGTGNCPVKVIASSLVLEKYTNYKNIKLNYKNVSKKSIQAIRFEWYGENSFNEPAEMGNSLEGTGGGFTDETLNPSKTTSGIWQIYSKDAKKIISARAYEVAFKDGTFWKLRINQ